MTQPPFPPGMSYADPSLRQSRSNGWAVASFVCSLLFCVPIISGLLGIIFGIIGVRKSRMTNSGKGLAIAGIALGVLFTLGWAGCGGGAAALWLKSRPVRETSKAFLSDAIAGNTSAALALCSGSVTADEINNLSATLAPMGPVKSITALSFSANSYNGGSTKWVVAAVVFFNAGQPQTIQLTLTKVGDAYKVIGFVLQGGASAMPTSAPASTSSARLDRTTGTADPAFAAAF